MFFKNWYNVSAVFGLMVLVFTIFTWDLWDYLQALSLLNLAVIFFHFYEEFGFPGGFLKFANTLFAPKNSIRPDRYPLNQMSAVWINFSTAFFIYLLPVVFYEQIWLGLAPMIFGGVAQLVVHGFVNNKMLRTYYNSGLCSVLFGHFLLMAAYIYYAQTQSLAVLSDYVIAAILMVVWYVGVIRVLIPKIFEDENSPYPFSDDEMSRFDRLYKR